ncbi:MAG TPA: UvrD-helicase domain-containing protein [Patescibacteria group bacterium]|nr:UvrD-helicase domain-containing protein [Patescibacteria group bacterium]
MSGLLKELNKEQLKAVTTIDGPILILAGAGSGKTRVITYRIAYLISQGIRPENILAVTFTNKAADEMKKRVAELLGLKDVKNLWIGTFHSICARILRREITVLGYERNFSIYDTYDQAQLIKDIEKELGYDEKSLNPKAVASRISGTKNEMISPEIYQANYVNSFFEERVAEVYVKYQKRLKAANALDFDDLILKFIEIMDQFPQVQEKYQKIFQYILVDEYQDTNKCQYMLIKMLVGERENICVVGDPDQSIYNFRGADIRNILNFEKDHPKTKIFMLEENYRSTKNILDCAQKLIENNTQRKDKKLKTKNDGGDPVIIFQAFNEREEGEYIVSQIDQILKADKKTGLNDIVVFYRTHAQSRALEETFLNFSVPYRIIGGVGFYERKEVKDLLAYLKIINNPADFVSLKRIVNVPARGIGDVAYAKIGKLQSLDDLSDEFINELDARTKKSLGNFSKVYLKLKEVSSRVVVSELINEVIKNIEYKEYLIDGSHEGEGRWENVKELLSVAKRFDGLTPNESLETFLQDVSLITNADQQDYIKDSVSMMTLHSAKGLEFNYVFIVGMEEGIFPHSQSMTDFKDLEEERRLCYVGVTRAKKRIYLLYANSRMLYGGIQSNPPSRFLEEMPQELLEYKK